MNSSRLNPLKRRLTYQRQIARDARIEERCLRRGICAKCGTWVPQAKRNYLPDGTWVAT